MAVVTKTLRSSGGDYSLMSLWESSEQTDLVFDGDSHVLECYADWPSGLSNTCYISGWTCGASNTLTVKAAAGEEHGGVSEAGFWMTGSTTDTFKVDGSYTFVYDLEFVNTGSNNYQGAEVTSTFDNSAFERCIVRHTGTATGSALTVGNASPLIINNLVENSGSGIALLLDLRGGTGCKLLNNTFIGDTNKSSGTSLAGAFKNNAVYGDCTIVGSDADYNAFSGTGAFGTNQVTFDSTDFEDYAGGDYIPASGGALEDAGTDLSGTFTDDIAGFTREVPWEIGAYETQGGAAVIQFDGPDIINQSAIQDSLYTFDANGEGIVSSRFSGTGAPFVYEKSPAGGAWPDGISVNGTTGNPVGSPIVSGTFAGLAIRASTEDAAELFTTITEGSGATWNGTTLTLIGLNATAQLAGTPTNGTEYHIKFDYDVAAGETLFIRCGGGANQDFISGPAVGSYDEVLVSQGTDYLAQLATGSGTHTFSNFSVKEVLTVATEDTNLFDMVIAPAEVPVEVGGGASASPASSTGSIIAAGLIAAAAAVQAQPAQSTGSISITAATGEASVSGASSATPAESTGSLLIIEPIKVGGGSEAGPAVSSGDVVTAGTPIITGGSVAGEAVSTGAILARGHPLVTGNSAAGDAVSTGLTGTLELVGFDGHIGNKTTEVGGSFSQDLSLLFTGSFTPFTYAVQGGTLPPGITLDANSGVMSGTATTVGEYPYIIIRATDQQANVADSNSFNWDVTGQQAGGIFEYYRYKKLYERFLGPLAQSVTLKVNNGTGWDEYTGVRAHVSRWKESDLVPNGPVQLGDLKLIVLADSLPSGLRRLEAKDRIEIDGRDYGVINWDAYTRSIGDGLVAVEATVRGG